MKFIVDIQDYAPGGVLHISTADIEEAIQDILDGDASDGIVIVEAADEEARQV